MSKIHLRLAFGLFVISLLAPIRASMAQDGYDDYGSFQSDPVDLDNEVSDYFGRFFQSNFHLGTAILTGGLGQAFSAGVLLGMRFVFYFDKIWAVELSGSWAHLSGGYNSQNTSTSGVSIQESLNLVPLSLGLRYGFDQDTLPRGFSAMNPYLVAAGEFVFRSESVQGTPVTSGLNSTLQNTYTPGAVVTGTGVGVNFGGGAEFDVYKKKIFLGLDLRYHLMFWSDGNTFVGQLDRQGDYFSILGSASYNY